MMRIIKRISRIIVFAVCLCLLAGCGKTEEKQEVPAEPETKTEAAAQTESKAAEASETASKAAQEETAETDSKAESADTKSKAAQGSGTETESKTPQESGAETKKATAKTSVSKDVTAESLMEQLKADQDYFDAVSCTMTAEMNMSVMGAESKGSMSLEAQTSGKNSSMKGKTDSVSYGESDSREIEQYILAQGEDYVIYVKNPETMEWEKSTVRTTDLSGSMIPMPDPSGFTLETVKENGKEQYKVTGEVGLDELLDSAGASLGMILGELFGMGMEELQGSVSAAYYFDPDTKALERVDMDMTEAFDQTFKTIMNSLFGELGGEEEGGGNPPEALVRVDTFTARLENIVTGVREEIVLPETAKEAVVIEEDPFETFETSEEDEKDYTREMLSVDIEDSFEFKDEYLNFTFSGKDFRINQTTVGEVLKATGIELDEMYQGRLVRAGDTDSADSYFDNYDYVSFAVVNTGDKELPIEDCTLYGISMTVSDNRDCRIAGLGIGSTLEEILSVLGNPTTGYESEHYRSYSWEAENYSSLSFSLGEEDGATGMGVTSYDLVW